MAVTKQQLITRGVFAVSIVAATAVVGVVGFAKADTVGGSGNGYGTGSEQALAASDAFEDGFNDVSGTFYETVVTDIIPEVRAALTANGQNATDAFAASFDDASVDYDDTVKSALDTFRMDVMAAKNTAEGKDQFIDAFNRAKNDYFNSVDAAKNKFADDINRLGGDNNARAKDMFMNKYNMARDMYNNEVEKVKNDFAATIG